MADLFLSDVHLRLDRPDRGERLARVVDALGAGDRLFIVGDLADFWFATREARPGAASSCAGLRALRAFRDRGGLPTLMLGNHDAWLGPYYERELGLAITPEPHEVTSHGLRVRMEHGHRAEGKPWWKGAMESRAFFEAFRRAPGGLARQLQRRLDASNDRTRDAAHVRMIALLTERAETLADPPDLLVYGHIHQAHDARLSRTRLIVLGDWIDAASNTLRIDEEGVAHVSIPLDGASRFPTGCTS